MVVAGAVLVAGHAVVVGQLQDRVLARQVHEDVDRLVADRHPARLFEADLLVEGDRAVDVADPVAGVQEGRHSRPRLPASLQFAAEWHAARASGDAGRIPRSGRRSRSPWGSCLAVGLIAGRGGRQLGGQRLRVGAAALQPQTGGEGPFLGDLRRRRQPDRLHPRRKHPPAGLLGRRCRRASGTPRSRSRTRTTSTTARSTRPGSPAPPGRTCSPAASRSRAPRRSPSSWSATSTSRTPKRRWNES